MNAGRPVPGSVKSGIMALLLAVGTGLFPGPARAESCALSSQHAGVTFPVERVDADWACRLQSVIGDHTTANKIGPLRTALSETMYRYLLDRPPLAAALIDRLGLARYQAEARAPGRYWGADGEGIQGLVQLVYEDPTSRIYFLEGTHGKRFLPQMSGKAVVLLRMHAVKEPDGTDAMDSTMIAYTKLDNRLLSGLVSLLRPLVGGVVMRKLTRGVETVNRLGQEMRQRPDRVLLKAAEPPPLAAQDVAFLKDALSGLPPPGPASRPEGRRP